MPPIKCINCICTCQYKMRTIEESFAQRKQMPTAGIGRNYKYIVYLHVVLVVLVVHVVLAHLFFSSFAGGEEITIFL